MEEKITPDVLRQEVETRLEELFFGKRGLLAGITHCTAVKEPYLTATLILLFSTIDILGFLNMPESKEENGGDDFQAWTAEYLSEEGRAFATDLDLWSARCGIVHALSTKTRLTSNGRAVHVTYFWGKEEWRAGVLNADPARPPDVIALPLGGLVQAVSAGAREFIKDVLSDVEKCKTVRRRLGHSFINLRPGADY